MGQGRKSHVGWGGPQVRSIGAMVSVAPSIVAVAALVPGHNSATELAAVCAVVTWIVVLFADVLFYLHWRTMGAPAGWIVLGLTVLAVQSLTQAASLVADPVASAEHPGWLLLVRVIVAGGLLGMVLAARGRRLRLDPVGLGIAAGVAVVMLWELLATHTGSLDLTGLATHALRLSVLLVNLVVAAAIVQLAAPTRWVRAPLGGAMVLLAFGHAASYPAPDGAVLSVVSMVMNSLGAAVLVSLAVALVSTSWADNRAAIDLLSRQLERVEAGARVQQARLHELRATVAGLGTASRLMHQKSAVSETHRRRIEDMIDSEMERLQRLLGDETTTAAPVDLDSTIEPIVVRHRTQGHPVEWQPSRHRAIVRADDVAEVVNVLLENALRHASGAGASIETRRVGRIVEIAVSDTGPGVDPALRSRIFDWGERGQESPGIGIGLNIAQQLTADLGGYLRLVESPTPGATFVLGLPAEDPS